MPRFGAAHAYIARALATEHQARIRTSFAAQPYRARRRPAFTWRWSKPVTTTASAHPKGARPCGTPS
jgi:hypothetical protein